MLRRHVLLVLAALAPAGALAQTAGRVTFDDAFINAAECDAANSREVDLTWVLQQETSFVAGGDIRIYASNRDPAQNASPNQNYCLEADGDNGAKAAPVGQVVAGTATTATVRTAALATAAGYACTDTLERPVYVCVHYRNTDGTRSARASGVMTLQTAAPSAPTLTSVSAGDGRLFASWTAPSGGAVTADRYVLTATPSGGQTRRGGETSDTSGSIGGLTNGTVYAVRVIALSQGKNESPASNAIEGTPAPTRGFWDTYEDQGGVEEGGCQTGAAGALALLGLAALARGRRRS